MLLSYNGRMLYNARALDVKPFFSARGTPVPDDWNPADHLLDYASSPSHPHDMTRRDSSILDKGPGSDWASPKDGFGSPMHGASLKAQIDSRPQATRLTQLEVLAKREIRNLKRDWSLVVSSKHGRS